MSAPATAPDRAFRRILWGLLLGLAVGVVFGDAVQPLRVVANAFIRLLQVNVLPYMLGSLIASLGRHAVSEMKGIARAAAATLLAAWAIALALVVATPLAFPPVTPTTLVGALPPPEPIDWLDLYIPSNLFRALANNFIPAVVLFGVLAGTGLAQMSGERKDTLLQVLDAFNEAMARVSRLVLRLTPLGLFAVAAVTAGEIRMEDVLRLQVWLFLYAAGALLLTFGLLPLLAARTTGVPYRRLVPALGSALATAAAAGDVLVVLPLIAEELKTLLVENGAPREDADRSISVALPLLYNFPHAGKLLSLAFLPFAAWTAGTSLTVPQYAVLVTAGPLSLFGNINAVMPFLLDLMRLPADLFELFTLSGVLNRAFGSMTAAMHMAAVSLVVASVLLGRFALRWQRLARVAVANTVLVVLVLVAARALFAFILPPGPSGLQTLSAFVLRPPLVAAEVATAAEPDGGPAPDGRLRRILARGVLRVGFHADAVPWAFRNASGMVVGYDVEAAHRLAGAMGVRLLLVETPRAAVESMLEDGRVDIVMSGYAATVARAERVALSGPYNVEQIGFLVRDHERARFTTLDVLGSGAGLTIAVPGAEGAAIVASRLPAARTVSYETVPQAALDPQVTATMTSMERAYYWSRIHPELSAVQPDGLQLGVPLVYALPAGEASLRDLVDLWIETRRASGELTEAYDYWIRGGALVPRTPRWSVVRDVLGWR